MLLQHIQLYVQDMPLLLICPTASCASTPEACLHCVACLHLAARLCAVRFFVAGTPVVKSAIPSAEHTHIELLNPPQRAMIEHRWDINDAASVQQMRHAASLNGRRMRIIRACTP